MRKGEGSPPPSIILVCFCESEAKEAPPAPILRRYGVYGHPLKIWRLWKETNGM